MLPLNWGAIVHSWLVMFAKVYPFLEELRLKRMTITDESLDLLAKSFPGFKALSLSMRDGFTEIGLKAIASHCRNLTELNIQDCRTEERLVSRCKLLRVLKVNDRITLEQLQRLIVHVPLLTELGTGSFLQEPTPRQYEEIETAFCNCRNLQALSAKYPLQSGEFAKFLAHCPNLRCLWVMDSVEDKGLEAVGSSYPLLEELRVYPADPYDRHHRDGVTELGFLAVSRGCPKLHYVLYFCRRMTNAAVVTRVHNCPDFTHFRLCIMTPYQPDYLTNGPLDDGFGAVVKTCTKIKRLSVSGLLTDQTFAYIGKYAKDLDTLSAAFGGSSDLGMQCVLEGCPKLRKLEIRDCPFGDSALVSGREKYEMMRSLWSHRAV
ncbi:hypothetical protein SASPL_121323 [Salvia splendens]|uniref:Transport inhibitor response 1 n=1 Tax=Salvia splendens TaxID=180675 RepID=A0A8X8ZX50_SALSN|nr:hypothetical protein SASPL_121323 [Salvia splendens]